MHQLAGSSPYTVVPAEGGFDVVLDAVDAQWTTLAMRRGLRRTVTHQVRLDETARTCTINDRTMRIEWAVGAQLGTRPRFVLRGSAEMTSGRAIGFAKGREYGLRDDGTLGVAAGWDFSLGEGRELVRWAAREQGWSESLPRNATIGLWVAGVTVGLLLVAGLVVGLLALLERL
ncbi:hypothetical protein TEK04_01645 [Klenkia sp. LSe6-5]|uniref:Uncharacterized protein n=1 Tax=Klenkia sesuvii TaxID=3103137 RepID=A0ABU8DNL1_9ACTN